MAKPRGIAAPGDSPPPPPAPPHADDDDAWRDVYALHFPPPAPRSTTFSKGVGLGGYDRKTGTAVPSHPVLQRPGESAPAADPFVGADGKKLRPR